MWQPLPDPGKIKDQQQNLVGMDCLQTFLDNAPPELLDLNFVQPELHQQNIDPQAMQGLVQLLKKLRSDIDRLLMIFDK
jgi:hypothetical protein